MGDEIKKESLSGHWVRSNEEDRGKQRVYRPQGFKFPPARGRESMELRPDGSFIRHSIGASDKRDAKPGTWKLSGSVLALQDGQTAQQLKVVSATQERLVVES